MGFGSLWHWGIVLVVVLILFGRGRISEIMGDFGSGIKSFKQGMSDEDGATIPPQAKIASSEGTSVSPRVEARTGKL